MPIAKLHKYSAENPLRGLSPYESQLLLTARPTWDERQRLTHPKFNSAARIDLFVSIMLARRERYEQHLAEQSRQRAMHLPAHRESLASEYPVRALINASYQSFITERIQQDRDAWSLRHAVYNERAERKGRSIPDHEEYEEQLEQRRRMRR